MNATSLDVQLIARVEQFYFREARLLDERRFQQWIALVDQSIEYTMPTRYVPQPDSTLQDTEEMSSVDRELDRARDGRGSPLRHDNFLQTFVRTYRPLKANAWSELPPPRTRRFISNVEVIVAASNDYQVYSNFQLFYSHSGADNHLYTGGRRDQLKEVDGEIRLFKREVITDMDIITVPTMALIF